MWKIVVPVFLSAVLSLCSGDAKPGVVYLDNYSLRDEKFNEVCSCNDYGTLSCKASPGQKLDFISTWVVEGVDCANLWISLIWRDLNQNASTRSYACPDPCRFDHLVIHGECPSQVVPVGKHVLEPFRFTVPRHTGSFILDMMYDADYTNGANKTRDFYLNKMYVDCA